MDKSAIYDQLYSEASAILERDSPCEVSCNTCLDSRRKQRLDIPNVKPFCCDGCKYLTPTGCGVKALGCRVWLCYEAQEKHPTTFVALNKVRARAEAAGIPMQFRGSKEDHLGGSVGVRMSRG